MVDAWKQLHQEYESAGVAPNTYVLDNETSAELKKAFKDKKIQFQLVPPHNHRNNLAEQAI